MSAGAVQSPASVLRTYFRAKDENRPYLLRTVFCEEATLCVRVNTDSIAFPAESHGLPAIADVLVRKFGQTYENVHSFYLSRPPSEASQFVCRWLVGMSQKEDGQVRVGCGHYEWSFQEAPPHLVSKLVISIEAMQTLAAHQIESVFAWLERLSYPWSSASEVLKAAPANPELEPVLQYVRSSGA